MVKWVPLTKFLKVFMLWTASIQMESPKVIFKPMFSLTRLNYIMRYIHVANILKCLQMAVALPLDQETPATVTLDLETPAMAATAATVNLDMEIVPATVDTDHLSKIHPITIQTDLMEVHNHPTLKELQLFAFGTMKWKDQTHQKAFSIQSQIAHPNNLTSSQFMALSQSNVHGNALTQTEADMSKNELDLQVQAIEQIKM